MKKSKNLLVNSKKELLFKKVKKNQLTEVVKFYFVKNNMLKINIKIYLIYRNQINSNFLVLRHITC